MKMNKAFYPKGPEESRISIFAYFALFVVLIFIGTIGYAVYDQSGNISDSLPGLGVLVGAEDEIILEGNDNPLQINYTLQENEDGEFRLTCEGDLLGFQAAVREANGQYIAMYLNAILVISSGDQVTLDLIMNEMTSIVDAVDALPIPSCISFMGVLGESHRAFFDALLFLVDTMNATDPQIRGQIFANFTANNNGAFLANGFFFGKLELTIEFVEGIDVDS